MRVRIGRMAEIAGIPAASRGTTLSVELLSVRGWIFLTPRLDGRRCRRLVGHVSLRWHGCGEEWGVEPDCLSGERTDLILTVLSPLARPPEERTLVEWIRSGAFSCSW